MYQPPGGYPPGQAPPPPQNKALKPLLIGCAAVLVLFVVLGGIGTWFAWHAMAGAIKTASDVAAVAKGAADSAQQAETQNLPPGSSPDPAQAAAAGVAALKSLVGGGKGNLQTLSRDELKTYLPASVGSLARSSADSSAATVAGISGTNATGEYGDATNGTVEIEITDAANMGGLTAFMDLMMNAVQSDNDEGYQKTTNLGDVKVNEKWVNSGKHAELIGVVNSRFVVAVTSNGVDMATAEQAFQAVDIAKLNGVPAAVPAPAQT
jgi:hypothetical protein